MKLTEETFLIFAAKFYDTKKSSGIDEFNEDIKRFQYLKRLMKRYVEDDDLRIRLMLNHLIILYNCFGPSATPLLFLKLKEYHPQLKTFLLFLGYMPSTVEYEDVVVLNSDIPIDMKIANELRSI